MMKKEKNEKKSKRWAAVLGAVVVVLATALTSTRTASKLSLSLFFKKPNSCRHCPQDSKGYSGIVEDCCCDYETMDSVNAEVLHPLLQEIVKTPFFRYFKVLRENNVRKDELKACALALKHLERIFQEEKQTQNGGTSRRKSSADTDNDGSSSDSSSEEEQKHLLFMYEELYSKSGQSKGSSLHLGNMILC